MQFFIIFTIFVIKSCSAGSYDSSFLIFIGTNHSDYQNLTINSNLSSVVGTKYFNLTKPSILIVHGWRENFTDEVSTALIDAFLTRPEYNIIFTDWSVYAQNGDYFAAAGAVNEVAQVYIQFLNKLKAECYNLSKIYAVGHSLGAHLAGKIGSILQSQNIILSRITGLDPAGPLFIVPIVINFFGIKFTLPGNNLLVKGNARFVDIIHTDAGVAGTMIPTGDLDFWPNGGSVQPLCTGCGQFNILNAIACEECEHAASWRYYAESVRSPTPNFSSLKCPSGATIFTNRTCTGPGTASMGFHANITSQPGNYYLKTRSTAPYSY